MKARQKWWLIALVAATMTIAGCSNDSLDDGDSADVILEVRSAETPPVTAALDMGICTFTVSDWTLTLRNRPKNGAASTPFNDIILDSVVVEYAWIGGGATPSRTFGLGGVAIEVDSEGPAMFSPIALDDLSLAFSGSTANVTLTINAHTVEGTTIRETYLTTLNVETCA